MKTLIVTGGNVDVNFLKTNLEENEYDNIIAVDKGLEALDTLNIKPTETIGDFDSIRPEILNKYKNNIITLNKEKDYTDTHMALKIAIDNNASDITIIGGIGSRLDHTIANVHILKIALDKNIPCKIINENNKVFLIKEKTNLKKDEKFQYISLIPLTTKCTGITLEGLKYTLKDETLNIGESIGISNEQIEKEATIDVKEGILIIIYSKD